LRADLRQRERLVEYAAAHIQHMQKALMEMNLQLHHVVSDITGATGMRIIRAIVSGERNPDVLATFRDVRCHSSTETIRAAFHRLRQTLALQTYWADGDPIKGHSRISGGFLPEGLRRARERRIDSGQCHLFQYRRFFPEAETDRKPTLFM
jgi:hypothetical protein